MCSDIDGQPLSQDAVLVQSANEIVLPQCVQRKIGWTSGFEADWIG